MTYQEIKDRLSKCELTLEKLKNGSYNSTDVKQKTEKLEILRESYVKLLKEAEKTAFINGNPVEYEKEDELKKYKDNSDVKSIKTAQGKDIKEQDGTKFSVDETKSIAKRVGKAVAQALRDLGDAVHSMKAKRIEENSFEIEVNYKGQGPNDEFSFYIVDDTLHLVDFSFDKELVDVGVKPSGEAIVHVDVLANELVKHFKSMNETEVSEAPEGMYYIKIPKDAASQNKAQVIFNDLHGIKYEINDDPKGIVMYFKKEDFNAGVIDDLEGDGVQILDTNIPMNEEETDDENTPAIDRMYNSDAWVKAQQDAQENKAEDTEGGDLDVGHQDDEPDMLKQYAYDIATYAAKLYKQLDKYDKMDGEIDFPNWWQSKVILAKDYISKAQHYLEFEEKQPAIDQLALEEEVNERLRFLSPEKQKANDAKFDKRMALLKALEKGIELHKAGKISDEDLHNLKLKAGTISADSKFKKENVDEAMSSEQKEAIYELENILDQAAQLGDEARQIVKQHFPNELSAGDAYDVFNFGSSSNSYDKTLETLISDIQRTAEEEDMDMDEGIAKTQKAHGLVVAKMKELAKLYKAGDKSVVAQLKDLTAKKKQLEKQLEKDVSGTNRGQELTERVGGADDIIELIKARAMDATGDEQAEVIEVTEFMARHYFGNDIHEFLEQFTQEVGIDIEFGAGPSRQEEEYKGKHQGSNYKWPMSKATKDRKDADVAAQAAKKKPLKEEKSTCCGKCGRKHVKGTKCKTPYLKGKDHCRNN